MCTCKTVSASSLLLYEEYLLLRTLCSPCGTLLQKKNRELNAKRMRRRITEAKNFKTLFAPANLYLSKFAVLDSCFIVTATWISLWSGNVYVKGG